MTALHLERDIDYEHLTGFARFDVIGAGELVGLITQVRWIGASWGEHLGWSVREIRHRLFDRQTPGWLSLDIHETPQAALEALADHRARR